jgi:NAD binding domain of 6-phosphogluconate dehydrogenase
VAHIAFIGLGKMGRPMATTLVRAGYGVRGTSLVSIGPPSLPTCSLTSLSSPCGGPSTTGKREA